MNKNTFISEAKEKRKKLIEKLTLEILAKMLNQNICYLDAHYIQDRSQEILEKTIQKLTFNSEVVQKARRAFLDVLLDGAKKQLFGFKDDEKQAKTDIKSKGQRKELAKEVLRSLERMEKGVPKGLTEQRNVDCEPVCQLIASELLSPVLLLEDENFVNGCIEMDNEMLVTTLYKTMFDDLFDQIVTSLDKSYIAANESNWGCRRDQIKLKSIDNRLKK